AAPLAGDARLREERVEVDAHDRVDRVDEADRVAAALLRGARRVCDVADVRRELHDDGRARDLFDPLDDLRAVLRYLTDGGAHPALAHPMRAAEVELEPVCARVL